MSVELLIEQGVNGLQLGLTLYLLAAGLTLIFGIMGILNLAHGSMYMVGAYSAAVIAAKTGSFLAAALGGALMAGGYEREGAGGGKEGKAHGGGEEETPNIRAGEPERWTVRSERSSDQQ